MIKVQYETPTETERGKRRVSDRIVYQSPAKNHTTASSTTTTATPTASPCPNPAERRTTHVQPIVRSIARPTCASSAIRCMLAGGLTWTGRTVDPVDPDNDEGEGGRERRSVTGRWSDI